MTTHVSPRSATAAVPATEPPPPRAGVDRDRWPDVAAVPHASAVRTAVARALVARTLDRLPLRHRLDGGAVRGERGPLLDVRDADAFFRRIGRDGLVGFGESYLAAEWDSDDLVAVLGVLAAHVTALVPASLQRLRGLWARRRPAAERNTPEGARGNIQRHYDLSNDLFALFLDETMTYSCGVFERFPAQRTALAAAQRRKVDRLLDLAQVGAGTRLVEIGTGWGELALRAADRGAEVVTVTLSREQREFALRRIAAAGHGDRVTVLLRDYREVEGEFDAVVSVEMIEAVGAEYWPVYFRTLRRLLVPGGRIALQAITMPHDRMLATRGTFTWIHKYVFPGGMLPSVEAVHEAGALAGLHVARDDGYGGHYAETLRLWREEFTGQAGQVGGLGFDATFRRMWEFYLAYSEAGFRSRYLDVRQLLLAPGTTDGRGGAR